MVLILPCDWSSGLSHGKSLPWPGARLSEVFNMPSEHSGFKQDRPLTRADRSEAVYRATLAIATELSIDAVLQKIVDAARELVNTRYAALGVVDEERRRLTRFL